MIAPQAPGPVPAPARALVVVSNRLPYRAEDDAGAPALTRSPGGLVAALEPALVARGGVWVGWDGTADDPAKVGERPAVSGPGGVRYRAVGLTAHEIAQYYAGFANRTLWPLFHYSVDRTRIDGAAWQAYERVNERFARVAWAESAGEALIWVHDYQLLRVPHYLRKLRPRGRIAFFLHIPFPASDVFRILPWSRSLLRGMLACDLVVFHVPSYVQHFLACAERLLGCEVDRAGGVVRFEGHTVVVRAIPISIDVGRIEEMAQAAGEVRRRRRRPRIAEVLGVDRLDYTKGIHERLLAVERLFERWPALRRHVRFTQVMVPSRQRVAEYATLKREIDEAVGRINGRFAEEGWSPVRYLVRSLPPEELVPLYRRSDVALVTPLRDGMNLVAKEYVAAQLENDGVLVLSELAGAADELQEALLVNPFDIEAVAEALHRALTMPEDERRARMSALRDRVRTNDVHAWVRRFLAEAEGAWESARQAAPSAADVARRRLVPWLAQRPAVALFLDYDGTLTPLVTQPDDARLGDAAREILQEAARTPNLDIAIVSGRGLDDLRERVGVPGLTYVGDHGFAIEGPGIAYRHPAAAHSAEDLDAAARDLDAIGVPGAWVERKAYTIAYHLRGAPEDRVAAASRLAQAVVRRHRLAATSGHHVVEGRPDLDWHKGRAVLHVLLHRHGTDWPSRVRALYVGDDRTDEDAFRSLVGIGRSIRVGASEDTTSSGADLHLPDPDAVLQLLRWLASGAFARPQA
jgi:trehalose 6-phosphate synthase/phosphatase